MATTSIWARIDVDITEHPKCLEAGEDATNLLIRGILWCRRYLTDGRIPKAALHVLTRKPDGETHAAALIRVGLWIDDGEAWVIRDFLQRNPSKAEVEAQKDARATRKQNWKERNANGTQTERVPVAFQSRSEGDGGTPLERCVQTQEQAQTQITTPPFPPASQGEPLTLIPPAANDTPKRKRKERKPLPEVEAVREEVLRLVGVDYPEHTWDGLRALIRKGTSGEDALAYVRWAATQSFERETLLLDPVVMFRHARFAAGLAKARGARAAPALAGNGRGDPNYNAELARKWEGFE